MNRWWLPLFFIFFALPAGAGDHAAEARMLRIAAELRCLVCQNESIAASRADLAVDLRQQIREQIQAGRTDHDIRAYMVERYGDFVLYRPPLKPTTLLLWFGPLLLFAFGILLLGITLRRRKTSMVHERLSAEEQRRAQALLEQSRDIGELR